ncbi:methyltransferase type 11 [Streptomyces bambusae]|uniref:methyltransferase type 11 n=1 Tax=Streptomyces bambusae TaxID=1550616 RepID=UPI001CFC5F35|nr:methyltransferase type 11 [Streptomyces bambusae]MCB5168600.1 methyltransferase type 11 [Streptomyces bambusae]
MTTTLAARDWAEIQERMLVPLYEAVHDRLGIGPGTRLLGLDCGAGLALLLGAARGARVAGVEPDPGRRELARERLLDVAAAPPDAGGAGYDVLTLFSPDGPADLAAALPLVRRGGAVVLAGWGPPERCATLTALGPEWRRPRRGALEDLVTAAGLGFDGSGRVFCPFGYADMESAVRGLLAAGRYAGADPGLFEGDPAHLEKELAEALHPYARPDGTVWLPNVFRYVIARVP